MKGVILMDYPLPQELEARSLYHFRKLTMSLRNATMSFLFLKIGLIEDIRTEPQAPVSLHTDTVALNCPFCTLRGYRSVFL